MSTFYQSPKTLDGYIQHARKAQNYASAFCDFKNVVARWQSAPIFRNSSVAQERKFRKLIIKLCQEIIGQ